MYNIWILPYLTILIILSFCSWFNKELIQAAGKSGGRWLNWSNIKDTNGLTTIDNPFSIIELNKYVKLLPEAVSDTNKVDFPYKILRVVSYWPYLNVVNPNISWINFYKFSFS